MNTRRLKDSDVSRRHWIGAALATCGGLVATRLAVAQSEADPIPEGYTRPGPVTERGRAPALQVRLLSEASNGEKIYAVIFGKGDEVLAGLTEFAEREKVATGYFTAIGALQRARFGWFDLTRKAYRNIPVDQQVEMITLIGDVGLVDGSPQIHAHGAVGLSDGQVRGGHLLQAIAWPTLEVFFTALPVSLVKQRDPQTGLSLFNLKGGQ